MMGIRVSTEKLTETRTNQAYFILAAAAANPLHFLRGGSVCILLRNSTIVKKENLVS